MNDSEWLTCADIRPMLHFVRFRASDRQLRVFAIACLRLTWDVLDTDSREAVCVGERYANNEIGDDEREAARRVFNKVIARRRGVAGRLSQAAEQVLRLRFSPLLVAERTRTGRAKADLARRQCEALREVVGDPFRCRP